MGVTSSLLSISDSLPSASTLDSVLLSSLSNLFKNLCSDISGSGLSLNFLLPSVEDIRYGNNNNDNDWLGLGTGLFFGEEAGIFSVPNLMGTFSFNDNDNDKHGQYHDNNQDHDNECEDEYSYLLVSHTPTPPAPPPSLILTRVATT